MKTIAKVAAPLLLVSLMATSASADRPAAGLIQTELTGALISGKDGTLELRFVPAKGLKWNAEYPAKVELKQGKNVEFKKTTYKKVKGEIVVDGRAGKATLTATGKKAGQETITAVVSASVCDAETCHVIRKREIPLLVVVR